MIYPKFLKKDDTIGICALSAGVGHKINEFNDSLNILKNEGYKIKESSSVRVNALSSNTPINRALELDELIKDENIKMVMCASGGDSQIETIPYINYKNIKNNPKWLMGASDPTNLLFVVTTMLDIATIYGFNAGGYYKNGCISQDYNLNILKGNLLTQKSFDKYLDFIDEIKGIQNYKKVNYKGNLKTSGRLIGGCLDCIGKLVGTKYDYVNNFIDKYKNDGIIWYFDIFSLSAYDTYLTLLQLKYAGYFRYCKGILFGRIAFPNTENSEYIKNYEEGYQKALENIKYVSEIDIGHTFESFTLINGALININIENKKGEISFKLD